MKTALRMIAASTVFAFCSATQAAEDPAADIAALKKLAASHKLIKGGDKDKLRGYVPSSHGHL